MQLSSLIPMITLLAIPTLAALLIAIKGKADSRIRSITLLVMLVLELAISIVGSFFGSELATLSPWGKSMGTGSTLFLLYAYPGFSSIALFCVGMSVILATRWLMIDQSDALVISGGLLITVLLALAGNLTAATVAIMFYALLRQTPELDKRERLKTVITDLTAITALIVADVLLRANNETSVLSFQRVAGGGMVALALASITILSQAQLRAKTSLNNQVLSLLSLVCGGLLWLRLVRLATGEFPLETWLLTISLVGALGSAWLYFRKTEKQLQHMSDYWIFLLVASGFGIQSAQPQVSMALYVTAVLAISVIICAPLRLSGQGLARAIRLATGYCLSGLPGALSGLASLAFLYNLYVAGEWGAVVLLFLATSMMIASMWQRLFERPKEERNETAIPVMIAYAIVPTIFMGLGLLPRTLSWIGSRLVLSFGLPEYPPLSSWPIYVLWIATIGAGLGIYRLAQSRKMPLIYREYGLRMDTLQTTSTKIMRGIGNGLVQVEQALEGEWFMPWILVGFAIISLLLSRS